MDRLCVLGGWACVGLVLLVGPARAQDGRYLGKRLAEWARDLNSNDPIAKRGALFALGKMGNDASGMLPQLLGGLKDGNASVREAAAFAVGEVCKGFGRALANPNVVPALTAALQDDNPLVKRSAAVALGNLKEGGQAAQTPLEGLLKHPNPAVRQNAAWALGQIGADSVDSLREVLNDPDALVRRDAANALGEMGGKARPALPELLACCKHPDAEVKKAALGVLIRLVGPKDTKVCETLQQILADRDVDVRHNAALAMANIGGPEAAPAVPVLVEALLQKGDLAMRRQAAAGLKNIGADARAALNPLRQALRDPDAELRMNAAVALGGLAKEAEPAVPDLLKLLADSTEKADVRAEAAVALSRIGPVPAAQGDIPALVAVLKDTNNPAKVRERTLWALRVHQQKLMEHPEVFDTLSRIVAEPRTQDSRMMRYDSAFLLGVFQRDKVPAQALNVLLEFLKDDTIRIYEGTSTTQTGGGGEKGTGKATVVETGVGDGRKMAVLALKRIGGERVRTRPDIIMQLRALESDRRTLPDLQKALSEAKSELGQ